MISALAVMLLATVVATAAPIPFDLNLALPPIIEDSQKPQQCTITYLMVDVGMNDLYAARMRIAPEDNARLLRGTYACPTAVPPRIGTRALDTCTARAANPKTCVFADMSRGFESDPELRNTAENAARCASDVSTHIAVACWTAGEFDVCNVACGGSEEQARAAARLRCAEKHGRACDITGSIPVLAP